ncbi:MAG: hypothetical protein M1819_003145 [Sarea resinae]|nr:MAG: hypothetical protein M1819_003145 [Sarea resinae]
MRYPGQKIAKRLLSSTRFQGVAASLFQPVRGSSFAGYWIIQNSLKKSASPKDSDVVIYFFHGGGYNTSDPGLYVPLLLRTAEAILDRGHTISIFALDYSLAPEYPFACQLNQASAGYTYLTKELGISSSKIALFGDSAGGNLCLALLVHLQKPLPQIQPNPSAGLSRPGAGLFLLSPWVNLNSTHPSFEENAGTDILPKASLDTWAKNFLRSSPTTAEKETYINFSKPGIARPSWRSILPPKSWISAGSAEVFYGDISDFVTAAHEDGADVAFNVKADGGHDWQLGDSLLGLRKYGARPLSQRSDGLILSADEIGLAIVAVLNYA